MLLDVGHVMASKFKNFRSLEMCSMINMFEQCRLGIKFSFQQGSNISDSHFAFTYPEICHFNLTQVSQNLIISTQPRSLNSINAFFRFSIWFLAGNRITLKGFIQKDETSFQNNCTICSDPFGNDNEFDQH